MTQLPLLVIATPLLCAFVLPLIHYTFPSIRRPAVTLMGMTFFGLVAWMALSFRNVGHESIVYPLGGWGPELGIVLQLDALSAVFTTLMSAGVLLVILYSQDYMDDGESKYYVLLFIAAAGMMGIVLTADFFNLYVFIEITAIASFPLVAVTRKGKAVFAAFYYMAFTLLSSALIFLAIILIYGATGSLNMAEVAAQFADLPIAIRSVVLASFIIGFGVKAALMPFHSWLPPAHAEAASPISALLSGVILKSGVYMMMRLLPMLPLGSDDMIVQRTLIGIGVVTIIGGHLLAMAQSNMKRILACSSMAHMGYIALGVGVGGPLGLGGALFHVLNHLLMKAGAFFAVGQMGHDFEIEKLRGSGHRGWPTGLAFGTCTGALVGLPPFGSCVSKIMIALAAIQAGMIPVAVFVPLGAFLSAIYYGKACRIIYDTCSPERQRETAQQAGAAAMPFRTSLVLGIVTIGCVATLLAAWPLSQLFISVAQYVLA